MRLIRNSDDLAAVAASTLDPDLKAILGGYATALEEFGDDLEATILIVQACDLLSDVESAFGERLVAGGRFTFTIELVNRHQRWFDVVRIISDDGSGLVLLVEDQTNTDTQLRAACEQALNDQPI